MVQDEHGIDMVCSRGIPEMDELTSPCARLRSVPRDQRLCLFSPLGFLLHHSLPSRWVDIPLIAATVST